MSSLYYSPYVCMSRGIGLAIPSFVVEVSCHLSHGLSGFVFRGSKFISCVYLMLFLREHKSMRREFFYIFLDEMLLLSCWNLTAIFFSLRAC